MFYFIIALFVFGAIITYPEFGFILLGIAAVIAIGVIVYSVHDNKKSKQTEIYNQKQIEKEEATARNTLHQYDIYNCILDILSQFSLEPLEELSAARYTAPKHIEYLVLRAEVHTWRDEWNDFISLSYSYENISLFGYYHSIDFLKDLRKNREMKDAIERSAFSYIIADGLIKNISQFNINGIIIDSKPNQDEIGLSNSAQNRPASFLIKIKNPNYIPTSDWNLASANSASQGMTRTTTTQPKHETKTTYAGSPAKKTAPAKPNTKPQAKSQPEKEQLKSTSDISLDDFNDNFDEWLKKRGG